MDLNKKILETRHSYMSSHADKPDTLIIPTSLKSEFLQELKMLLNGVSWESDINESNIENGNLTYFDMKVYFCDREEEVLVCKSFKHLL